MAFRRQSDCVGRTLHRAGHRVPDSHDNAGRLIRRIGYRDSVEVAVGVVVGQHVGLAAARFQRDDRFLVPCGQ